MSAVRTQVDGAIGHLILARPEARNALDRESVGELMAGLRVLGNDEAVRVVAVRGEGEDFCAGADLRKLGAMLDAPLAEHEADARSLGDLFFTIDAFSKPTVACVHGRALAGGAALAAACDMIVATSDASIGYTEVRLGFVPAMAMSMLLRWTTERTAFDLLASGRIVRADEAMRLGLISRLADPADFQKEVDNLLQSLAKIPPGAMRTTKSLLRDIRGKGLREAIELGARTNAAVRLTDDFRTGVRNFLERSRSKGS